MKATARRARKVVSLGYISGVHGVRGEVKVHSWTRPRAAIFDYQPWLLGEDRKRVAIEAGRVQGRTLVASLPGVTSRDTARSLVDSEIAVFREQLPATGDGEYYWADLVGLEVITVTGEPLGTVQRLMETGANDVLVVVGERERLIPYVRDRYVVAVDLDGRRLVVDWDPDF
jgi:16S rRNA processing protein RimM